MQEQEQNPYQPPSTNSINTGVAQLGRKLTIEEAIASDYDFSIGDILSRAWAQVSGTKLPFFLGMLVIMAIYIVVTIIASIIPGVGGIIGALGNLFVSALAAGFIAMSLKHLRGEQINFSQDFFSVFNIIIVLILALFLTNLLTIVGMLLLIIPGIYLSVAYYLTTWIIVDNPGTSAWQAMEASRKIITKQWFKVFGLGICLGLIVGISAIPFGIGLIWTVPLAALSMGILYQTIFGQ